LSISAVNDQISNLTAQLQNATAAAAQAQATQEQLDQTRAELAAAQAQLNARYFDLDFSVGVRSVSNRISKPVTRPRNLAHFTLATCKINA
jgi:multidrug efflux pump subunit AcrA (membrane-fusion protein)